ncbi:uncharacterized protein LOC143444914 isoform X2 [Clavelina lepadiformis]|uniref:uncharacterized protein LOC143444914 isoform X2 n=1 Tax=Clavelina lepadiformis TaxID=159417 RepID=UPI004042D305
MNNKEAVDLKAAAAAKLILQELDPAAKRKRQEFCSSYPQGILSVHAKSLSNFSKTFFVTSTFAGYSEIRLLLRISVQGIVKCSKTVSLRRDGFAVKTKLTMGKSGRSTFSDAANSSNANRDTSTSTNAEIALDELKIFSIELSQKPDDPRNLIKFELIEVENQSSGMKRGANVGQATIHLYDLLKEMYGNKLIPMMVKDKKIADVDLEYVFRYGALGYGYSHQLKQSDQSISHTLKESMFFNVPPTLERKNDDGFLLPCDISKPEFIPFKKDSEESTDASAKKNSLTSMYTKISTGNVIDLIENRKRLRRMSEDYFELSTRHDRTRFLESLVAKLGVTSSDGIHDSDDDDDADDGLPKQLAGMTFDSRRQSEAVKVVVGNVSPLLVMATGLKRRDNRSGVIKKKADFDIYNEDDGELDAYQNRPSTSESQRGTDENGRPITPETAQKKGFMDILRKRVLTPIRMKRSFEPSPRQVDVVPDAPEGIEQEPDASRNSQSASSKFLDTIQRANRISPTSSSESSPTTHRRPTLHRYNIFRSSDKENH